MTWAIYADSGGHRRLFTIDDTYLLELIRTHPDCQIISELELTPSIWRYIIIETSIGFVVLEMQNELWIYKVHEFPSSAINGTIERIDTVGHYLPDDMFKFLHENMGEPLQGVLDRHVQKKTIYVDNGFDYYYQGMNGGWYDVLTGERKDTFSLNYKTKCPIDAILYKIETRRFTTIVSFDDSGSILETLDTSFPPLRYTAFPHIENLITDPETNSIGIMTQIHQMIETRIQTMIDDGIPWNQYSTFDLGILSSEHTTDAESDITDPDQEDQMDSDDLINNGMKVDQVLFDRLISHLYGISLEDPVVILDYHKRTVDEINRLLEDQQVIRIDIPIALQVYAGPPGHTSQLLTFITMSQEKLFTIGRYDSSQNRSPQIQAGEILGMSPIYHNLGHIV